MHNLTVHRGGSKAPRPLLPGGLKFHGVGLRVQPNNPPQWLSDIHACVLHSIFWLLVFSASSQIQSYCTTLEWKKIFWSGIVQAFYYLAHSWLVSRSTTDHACTVPCLFNFSTHDHYRHQLYVIKEACCGPIRIGGLTWGNARLFL
jgi:hypothetical protein